MYKFKQAVHFPGKKMGKDKNDFALPDGPSFTFKCGDVCEVPDEVQEHPYFKNLVEAGLVVEAEPEAPKEDINARNKRLAEKLSPKSDEEAPDDKPEKGKKKK